MKKILLLASMLFAVAMSNVSAQETIMGEINYNDLEKYIRMAKDHYPQRKILNEQEAIAKNEQMMANLSYLEILNANYYYRPDEQELINPQNPYLTNGFQFGVTLNLGTFLQKPFQAKTAKSNLKVAQLEKEIYDAEMIKEVKSRYYNYILQLKELKLKTSISQEAYSTFQNLTSQFEKGEVTLEEFGTGRSTLSEANSSKIQTEVDYLLAKDALEQIIGAKLEETTN